MIWKEKIEERRWRRKQAEDLEWGMGCVPESRVEKVHLPPPKREVVFYMVGCMFAGIEFLRVGRP